MKGKAQISCMCCGAFSATSLCGQCQFAGCTNKKKGAKCHLQTMAVGPVAPAAPVIHQ